MTDRYLTNDVDAKILKLFENRGQVPIEITILQFSYHLNDYVKGDSDQSPPWTASFALLEDISKDVVVPAYTATVEPNKSIYYLRMMPWWAGKEEWTKLGDGQRTRNLLRQKTSSGSGWFPGSIFGGVGGGGGVGD
jgi:hypothetical protein